MSKEWVKERKTHNQARPSPWKKQAIKNECSKTNSHHKRLRMSAKHTDKPPSHGKCMSSRQTLDTHGSAACTGLRHHQPEPSQYRSGGLWVKSKRGHSLAVGRRGEPILGFLLKLGGNVLLGWHATQKRERWVRITRCMPWGIVRENTHLYSDGNATMNKKTKEDSLCRNGMWHGQHR